MKRIVVLGSTGSIGRQTLDVVSKNPDELKVAGLVAYQNSYGLSQQAQAFDIAESRTALAVQPGAMEKILGIITAPDVDMVVNAMSGAAGLRASFEALKADKILALANKESLVVGGDLLMPMAMERAQQHDGAPRLLPIDSEHGAIFQCLVGEGCACGTSLNCAEESNFQIKQLWVTASGGPFFGKSVDQLADITLAQALAHPTWNMGPKITIDSSTLMNKGLEVIEAHHLFGLPYEKIRVVVQRESVIHSMVEYIDGSVKAHLGTTDMRIPIQYALSYPARWDAPVEPLDFTELSQLTFAKPDMETFKCLRLAYEAGHAGGGLPCVMNAANEVAVARFLAGKTSYLSIADCVENVMQDARDGLAGLNKVESIEQLERFDAWARKKTASYLGEIN